MQETNTRRDTKTPTRKPIPFRVKVEIMILAILALGIAIPFSNDLAVKAQLAPLNAVADQFDSYFKSYGGVETDQGYQKSYGLNFLNHCGLNSRCPAVVRYWNVPADPGHGEQFMLDALKKEGWTGITHFSNNCEGLMGGGTCEAAATKDRFQVDIHTGAAYTQIPTKNVSPRVWRSILIEIYTLK